MPEDQIKAKQAVIRVLRAFALIWAVAFGALVLFLSKLHK
jgi:hypothetical protein